MENQYKKTFADLMVNKKLVYVHGFMSSGATHTAKILQEYMPQCTVIAPDLPIHPEEAMELLRKIQADERPDIIIGTSMGGMYTEMLYGTDRICVNPAFQMGSTISESNMLGKQIYQNPRKDGIQEVIVTKSLQKEYKEITEQCFASVTPEEQERVYGLFGDADPIVHTFDLFHQHYPQAIYFHGEHRLIEKAIFHYVMPIIRWIMANQNHRYTRLTSFFSTTTMFILLRQHSPISLQVLQKYRHGYPMLSVHLHGIAPSLLISHNFFWAIISLVHIFMMSLWERYYLLVVMNLKHGKRLLLSLNG